MSLEVDHCFSPGRGATPPLGTDGLLARIPFVASRGVFEPVVET